MRNWWARYPKLRLTFIVLSSAVAGVLLFQVAWFASARSSVDDGLEELWSTLWAVLRDSDFWKTILPVLSVIAGIGLTSRLSHKRELHKDLRDRLMSATFDSLSACRNLQEALEQLGVHGPRGGGRTRPAGDEEAEWEEIDADEAADSDQRAAEAFEGIVESLDKLAERNLELSIVAPDELREAFEAVHIRVHEYLMGLGEIFRGKDHQVVMEEVEQLFEQAKKKSRLAVRSPKF